ncbi:family 78 glycoside hydrolase catalytic domain [Kitasatospora sp. NPDC057015]|uniref:family 78 glycoside hydrolase catalytic domain n=1 Tax=Kitasatospora sp. NPDC057015 TaxID=3346001 RepID=UPI003642C7DD
MKVTRLRFEHHGASDALGIGESEPRLSWTGTGTHRHQDAYEIEIRDRHGAGRTHLVHSTESVLVPWPGAPLSARERREVRVRLWTDGNAQPGPWSDFHPVEAGLLTPEDWTGTAVSPGSDDPAADDPRPAHLLRTEFELTGPVASARLYSTALGVHEIEINGSRTDDDVLAPGWTSYRDRLRYRTHDVTHLVHPGTNAIGAHLADGWYRGRLAFNGGIRDIYGDRTALLAQLEVRYADGTTATFGTGPNWRSASGPVTATCLLVGETHDARLERAGWSEPGFDDADWHGVREIALDAGVLTAPTGPPVRRIEERAPVDSRRRPDGTVLLDFGQNLVGRLRIRVRGEAGHTVTLRHAEILENGELCTRPLRGATATDHYTLRGATDGEQWEPRFTYHGFRYAELSGWPGEFDPTDVTAVVLHTDLERTGWFECSDSALNRLHENVVWSMRGNFLDIPTDCPQRDERLGWTGDIQVFAPTAAYLHDCAGMLSSWLCDLSADTARDAGRVTPIFSPQIPVIVPFPVPEGNQPMAGWGDAAVIVPWTLFQRYGDLDILRRQYDDMRNWVETVHEAAGPEHLWTGEFQFGDWLDPTAPPDAAWQSSTPDALVATAYFAHSTTLVAETAELLGRTEDSAYFRSLADDIRKAFVQAFVTAPGQLTADTQTAHALALQFDLLPDGQHRAASADRLARLVADAGHVISTGFLGTPLVCDALSANGHLDTAYQLLLQRRPPSWLYQVEMGATTTWERWDSLLPDGSVNPGEMTSFNHYALGAVADWIHRTVGGIAPAEPGYRALVIRPRPGGGITWARAAHRTPYGRVEVHWRQEDDGHLVVEVRIPPATTAILDLPGAETLHLGPGHHVHRT